MSDLTYAIVTALIIVGIFYTIAHYILFVVHEQWIDRRDFIVTTATAIMLVALLVGVHQMVEGAY